MLECAAVNPTLEGGDVASQIVNVQVHIIARVVHACALAQAAVCCMSASDTAYSMKIPASAVLLLFAVV
jgi:hypothetical protein